MPTRVEVSLYWLVLMLVLDLLKTSMKLSLEALPYAVTDYFRNISIVPSLSPFVILSQKTTILQISTINGFNQHMMYQ